MQLLCHHKQVVVVVVACIASQIYTVASLLTLDASSDIVSASMRALTA